MNERELSDGDLVTTIQDTDVQAKQLEADMQHLDHQLMDARQRLKRLRNEWHLRQLQKEP